MLGLARSRHGWATFAASLLLLLWACGAPRPAGAFRPQSSGSLSLAPDGSRLVAANPDARSITLVSLSDPALQHEVALEHAPQTAAFTPDSATVLVAAYSREQAGMIYWVDAATAQVSGQLAVGGLPHGIVADARRAYVSLFGRGQVAVIDLETRALSHLIDVEPFPSGLALASEALYLTHFYSGHVTRLPLGTLTPEPALATDPEANLSQFIALSPDGERAYLPQTLSHTANMSLTAESTVSPVVAVVDLAAGGPPAAQVPLYSAERVANLPLALAISLDEERLFVASAGTDEIWAIDLLTRHVITSIPAGRNPRGLALSQDGKTLFVHNVLDGTLSMVDVLEVTDGLQLSERGRITLTAMPLSHEVLAGKRLFNSALPPMSNGWLSCATCHFDGGHDARTWLGFPDGPRNTPALYDVAGTAPYHWSGDRPKLQDVELTIRAIQHGRGFLPDTVAAGETAGRSAELDALAAYLASLATPPSPYPTKTEAIERGARAYQRWGCATCHSGPLLTDRRSHALNDGIGDLALQRNPRGLQFDTPGLFGVWLTAPYFHDGSSATLRETLFRAGFHGMGWAMDAQEVEDVLAYLRALPLPDEK